jgi:VWFA-related protein
LQRTVLAIILCALTVAAQSTSPDAADLLARGAQLIPTRPGEAVKLLQQALHLNPDLNGLRYQLGLAYHAIGDEADAAAELREAVARMPDSADAHNFLGIALFESGDAKSARDEFRIAARLAPKDRNAHFNLGESMARTGDSADAVEELRIASHLAPSDAGLARLLKTVETKISAPEATIKVDVRQVLVPVVVIDSAGHHVTGLTQADFKIFEDGVEQHITAFSVEHSGVPQPDAPSASSTAPQQAAPSPPKPRRTYMIVIDTLHTSVNNLANARAALIKLFQQERSEDSQYVVIALGISPEMILNVTRDPSAVLAALNNKRLQKVFADGQIGAPGAEIDRFRHELTDTRVACDVAPSDSISKVKCAAGLNRATQQLQQVSELEHTVTVGYLRQLRSLVAQLAPARDRRTILLISDGFAIEPGREASSLMSAYFPPASHCQVPADVYCPPDLGLRSTNRMSEEFGPILKLAAASNITIDTIDSRGLYGQRAFDASSGGTTPALSNAVGQIERNIDAARGNTLREIADATGGTAFRNSNDILGGLQRAFADGRDYYTLAYVSTNSNYNGKFRAITVQVSGRDATVNAKRGYWAAPSAQ